MIGPWSPASATPDGGFANALIVTLSFIAIRSLAMAPIRTADPGFAVTMSSTVMGVCVWPGGTTAAGLKVLEERNIRATLMAAVEAAAKRSQELAGVK